MPTNQLGDRILGYSWMRRKYEEDSRTKDPRYRVHPQCLRTDGVNRDKPDVEIIASTNYPPACERCGGPIT